MDLKGNLKGDSINFSEQTVQIIMCHNVYNNVTVVK